MSIGVVACGALAVHIASIQEKYGLDLTIYPLPPLLHNSPSKISGEVDSLLRDILGKHTKCVVAYADCGTYGALDAVIATHGVSRLGGNHCYDVFAGESEIKKIMETTPGTYFLTDFLVKSFHHSVIVELGLDKRPDLRDDYFKHYRQAIWLAQDPSQEMEQLARSAAILLGLPLEIRVVGQDGLAQQLLGLVRA